MSEDLENVDQPDEEVGRRLSRRTMIAGTAGAAAAMWAAPAVTSLAPRAFAQSPLTCPPGEISCGDTCCPHGSVCRNGAAIFYQCEADNCIPREIEPCSPYACNPSTTSCYTSCNSDAQCDPNYSCDLVTQQCVL